VRSELETLFDPQTIYRSGFTVHTTLDPQLQQAAQQIARSLLLSPEEQSQRTALRKIREIMLAAEIARRYTKDEILELYLNQMYFGNLAYGVEAAAQTYFNTSAANLALGQASFLAGLLQAPSVYDVHVNRDATLERQRQVLVLMVNASTEQGCIFVSNAQQPICVAPEMAGAASAEFVEYEFEPMCARSWRRYLIHRRSIVPDSRCTQRLTRSSSRRHNKSCVSRSVSSKRSTK
jgi:membrane carboxypeptidase/penicillin-binding protein